jgi:L-ascorbate metabolism protein UlaG (beta-lactamase superfamily)
VIANGDEGSALRRAGDRARELAAAHRARPSEPRSFLLGWARALVTPPRRSRPGPLPRVARGDCAVYRVGHATVLLRWARAIALVDPCFARWLWTLRRAEEPAIPDGALAATNLVLVTHAHRDHLHRPSLDRVTRDATCVVPRGCGGRIGRGFSSVIEVGVGERCDAAGLSITAVAAQHGPAGGAPALGYIVRGDGPTVYVAGDTGWFSGFAEIGARFRPDVALLPIAGYRPLALRAGHLSPLDAVYALEDLGARLLVPVGYGAFPLGYEPPGEPARWMAELVAERGLADRVALLDPGTSRMVQLANAQPAS